ncbi:Rv3654c family TadE-like protein [Nonomuraea sp. NPDC050310]|uniref:Rv3654c family TadE-like protein n=1 Tax=Nonomuraea sp. NPDC050310 TaxID=3154935 RepID=UPI0033FB7395
MPSIAAPSRPVRSNSARRDRGSGTLWGVAAMAMLLIVSTAVATIGAARVARHRAQAGADLSALAAAQLVLTDPEGACRAAARVATLNSSALQRCAVTDLVVDVDVSVRAQLPIVGVRTVVVHARAGPTRLGPVRTTPLPAVSRLPSVLSSAFAPVPGQHP